MIKTGFGNFIVNDQIPEGTIYLVPKVEHIRYFMPDGEVKEVLQWNSKQGAIITNIGKAEK